MFIQIFGVESNLESIMRKTIPDLAYGVESLEIFGEYQTKHSCNVDSRPEIAKHLPPAKQALCHFLASFISCFEPYTPFKTRIEEFGCDQHLSRSVSPHKAASSNSLRSSDMYHGFGRPSAWFLFFVFHALIVPLRQCCRLPRSQYWQAA